MSPLAWLNTVNMEVLPFIQVNKAVMFWYVILYYLLNCDVSPVTLFQYWTFLYFCRFTRKYLLPCMLHCEVEKPNMLTYLSPLMQDLQCLHQTGIRVNTTNGKLLVKARLIAVATDLPARALVLNMKQFNGKYGCSICLDEGECPPGRPLLRFYPFRTAFSERTHQSMLTDANEACRTGTAVSNWYMHIFFFQWDWGTLKCVCVTSSILHIILPETNNKYALY